MTFWIWPHHMLKPFHFLVHYSHQLCPKYDRCNTCQNVERCTADHQTRLDSKVMGVLFLCEVQPQAQVPHLSGVQQQQMRMLCQQLVKVLSSSKDHTLWGNPRNHQRALRDTLQGTLIMTTLTPAEILGRKFCMLVAAASGQEAKLLVMGQVGAIFNKHFLFRSEHHNQGTLFRFQEVLHFSANKLAILSFL